MGPNVAVIGLPTQNYDGNQRHSGPLRDERHILAVELGSCRRVGLSFP